MKRILLILLYSLSLHGMHKELKNAIHNGDAQQVEHLLHKQTAQPETEYLPLTSLNMPNLDELHEFAAQIAEEKKKDALTLNNPHVYKQSAIGVTTLTGTVLAAVNSFKTGQWDLQTISVLALSAIALYHGANRLYLGITNSDARNAAAQHQAILAHIKEAKKDNYHHEV